MMKMNLSRTLENEILVPWEVFFSKFQSEEYLRGFYKGVPPGVSDRLLWQ